MERVDATAAPDWFGINCAHPTHMAPALDSGAWQERISAIRPNASTLTHDELDAMEDLDEGDLAELTRTLGETFAAMWRWLERPYREDDAEYLRAGMADFLRCNESEAQK